jgi:hypothetical protein
LSIQALGETDGTPTVISDLTIVGGYLAAISSCPADDTGCSWTLINSGKIIALTIERVIFDNDVSGGTAYCGDLDVTRGSMHIVMRDSVCRSGRGFRFVGRLYGPESGNYSLTVERCRFEPAPEREYIYAPVEFLVSGPGGICPSEPIPAGSSVNALIINNEFYNTGFEGIYTYQCMNMNPQDASGSSIQIINNTFVVKEGQPASQSWAIWNNCPSWNIPVMKVVNNLFWNTNDPPIRGDSAEVNHSNLVPSQSPFVDVSTGDLHLVSGTGAIDAASPIYAPQVDIEGRSRPIDGNQDGSSEPDIGAHEFLPSAAPDSWTPISDVDAPEARTNHTIVWTGTEMIVWGGNFSGAFFGNGGRYDPVQDIWTPLTGIDTGAPVGRTYHTAVWTGSEMIIWGGMNGADLNTGGRYDPVNDVWASLSTDGAPSGRSNHCAVWTGTEMIVWGGRPPDTPQGGRYHLATDSWSPMSDIGQPTNEWDPSCVWSGSEMIVWTGDGGGGRYDPVSDSWSPVSTDGAPNLWSNGRREVWTGSEMIIWDDGGFRYDPVADSWSTIDASLYAYGNNATAWTGDRPRMGLRRRGTTTTANWGSGRGANSWYGAATTAPVPSMVTVPATLRPRSPSSHKRV